LFFVAFQVKNIWQLFGSYANISLRSKGKILRIALCWHIKEIEM